MIWIFPAVSSRWLIDQLITNHIGLRFEIADHIEPHLGELIRHTILIFEKWLRKSHHIFSQIIFKKGYLHAVCFQRVALLVVAQIHFERSWEIQQLVVFVNQPIRKSLPTKSSTEQILVRVQDNIDPKFSCLASNAHYFLQIGVVILWLLWLKSLPRYKQSNSSQTPTLEITKISSTKRVKRIKLVSTRVEWKLLIHWIDTMIEPEPPRLINQISSDRINRQSIAVCLLQHKPNQKSQAEQEISSDS